MIARFVDIGGIGDHHCLHVFFIIASSKDDIVGSIPGRV